MNSVRNDEVLVGIPSSPEGLSRIVREVPDSEPAPWPENAKLQRVGKPHPRLDAPAKASGAARYTADIRLPRMLWGSLVTCPHPAARVVRIDTSRAERAPGVRGVHVIETITGIAHEREPQHFRPTALRRTGGESEAELPAIRYAGQPVVAIAAVSQDAADAGARLVEVEYEIRPFVASLDAAMQDSAPTVYHGPIEQSGSGGGGGAAEGLPQKGNVRGPSTKSLFGEGRGNLNEGFGQAEVILEETFETQVQTHSCLEPHGLVADVQDDGATIWVSTQDTVSVREEAAEHLGMKRSQVRVICEHMGGGFGAKYGCGAYGLAALDLSRRLRAPVRMMLDRKQEHLQGGNCPKVRQTLRVGARGDGALTAIQLTSFGTAGAALGAGAGNVAQALYDCPNFAMEQHDVVMNAGPGCAFRGPGNTEGAFAMEQMIDALAERIGTDPLALRDRIDPSPQRREQRRIGAELIGWERRRAPGSDAGPIKRGIGVAQAFWPRLARTAASACEVRILKDGSVEVRSSVQDLGTGTRTVLAQVVAEVLGLEPREVTVRIGDTTLPPGPGSGGSMVTGTITPAARKAAERARDALFAEIADGFETTPDRLEAADGMIRIQGEAGSGKPFAEAVGGMQREQIAETASRVADYGGFFRDLGGMGASHGNLGAVQFAEVSVDTELGIVRVERVVAVHDCGRPINPLLLQSQINGGIVQGISYALYEDRVLDERLGVQLNPTLDTYRIAMIREIPQITVRVIEDYQGRSSTDAFGVAEPANIPTAPAIANAFFNATGVRMHKLPMSPPAVLAALYGETK